MDEPKARLNLEVDALADDLRALSRKLYAHPELAFQEYKACQWLSDYLEKQGFYVKRGVGGVETAFYASPVTSDDASTESPAKVAFLAEYDALPKIGHGCGHNLIAAASIGAGIALSRCLDGVDGTVVVIGTPGEEGGGGKIKLLDAGIFDDVSVAMMFHPGSSTVIGSDSLGRIKFTVEFFGKSAHAAGAPEYGVNALDALILFFSSIGLLRQQLRDEAKIHGIITHGGDAPNIIPDYTSALMYVRALNLDYLEQVFTKIEHCAQGATNATGAEFKIVQDPLRYQPGKRSLELETLCLRNMELLGFKVNESAPHRIGSTDFGNLSQKIPAIHPYIAICGADVPSHSYQMAEATLAPLGQEVLVKAAKTLAMTAYDYLTSKEIQARVAKEFHAT